MLAERLLSIRSRNYEGKHETWRERLRHFTWSWFECTMSTGALAVLLSQQPYAFKGLDTIGKIVFIIDLVLFVSFCILISLRFYLTPGSFKRSLNHPHESFFMGTMLVSIGLIIYNINQYAVPSCGPWLVKTVEILFWIYAACVLLTAIFQYHVIFDLNELPITEMMPAWILPLYPFLILGPLAGALLYYQPRPSAAMPILIGGMAFQGLGWSFAFMQYTLYIFRLTNGQLPPEPKRAGMYVAVGPAAYTSSALVTLGTQAQVILPPGFLGITTIPVGDLWKAFGIAAGIFLWLLSFWFFALATVALLSGWRKAHYTLNMWALIFPNAGLVVALINIGSALSCTPIKAIGSAATILLAVAWLSVAFATVKAVYQGRVMWPHHDEDMEDIEGHEK